MLGQIGAMAAGLLVLPLTGHEHGGLDLVHERDRVERIGDGRVVVGVLADLLGEAGGFTVQCLVVRTGLIARLMRLYAHGWPAPGPAGSAFCWRSLDHGTAKPVLRIPPG